MMLPLSPVPRRSFPADERPMAKTSASREDQRVFGEPSGEIFTTSAPPVGVLGNGYGPTCRRVPVWPCTTVIAPCEAIARWLVCGVGLGIMRGSVGMRPLTPTEDA